MAYQNEFTHVDASELDLSWLLQQYATFNDRIAEILAHFDEVAEQMRTENLAYKNEVERLFNSYKNEIDTEVASINNAIEQVSNNVAGFVEEHMGEWQLEAMTGENNDIIIGDYDPQEPITDGGNLNSIIINNERVLVGYDSYKVFYSTSIHKNILEGFTQGQLITQVDKTMNPDFYNALAQIEEKMGEHFEDLYIPYNAILSGDSFSDDTEFNAIKNMGFRLGYMRPMRYDSNRIDVILNWARNANSTVGVTNGIYLMLNVQLPNL